MGKRKKYRAQKKLPILKQGEKNCIICHKPLETKLGAIMVYDEAFEPVNTINHQLQFCASKSCRFYYAYESDLPELKKMASPNHIKCIYSEDYKYLLLFLDDVSFYSPQPNTENVLKPSVIQQEQDDNTGLLIIYKNKCHCLSCERRFGESSIENRAMYIDCIWGKDVFVDVQFCRTCGKYYMSDVALQGYEMKFGRILIQRELEDFDWSSFNGKLNPESILHKFGYNTDQSSREIERQTILKHILDTGILEKYKIIDHLSFLISFNGEKCYMAKPKWEADIQFVSDYQISEQKIVYGLTPQKKYKAQESTANAGTLMDVWNSKLPKKKY
jgi:hypothetical protein